METRSACCYCFKSDGDIAGTAFVPWVSLCDRGHGAHSLCFQRVCRARDVAECPVCGFAIRKQMTREAVNVAVGNDRTVQTFLTFFPLDIGCQAGISQYVRELRRQRHEAAHASDVGSSDSFYLHLAPPAAVAACAAREDVPAEGLKNGNPGTQGVVSRSVMQRAAESNMMLLVNQHTPVDKLRAEYGVTSALLQRSGVTMEHLRAAGYTADELGRYGMGLAWGDLVRLGLTAQMLQQDKQALVEARVKRLAAPVSLPIAGLVRNFATMGHMIMTDLCGSDMDVFMRIGLDTGELYALNYTCSDLIRDGMRASHFVALGASLQVCINHLAMTPDDLRCLALQPTQVAALKWDAEQMRAFMQAPPRPAEPAMLHLPPKGGLRY